MTCEDLLRYDEERKAYWKKVEEFKISHNGLLPWNIICDICGIKKASIIISTNIDVCKSRPAYCSDCFQSANPE